MGAELDRLEIAVETSASKTNQQLDLLATKLSKVAGSLDKLNNNGLASLANGVDLLAKSIRGFDAIKTSEFTKLSSNLAKLRNINLSGLDNAGATISRLTKSVSVTGESVQQLASLSSSIATLGSPRVDKAIVNLPQLAFGIQNLMTILSKAPAVSSNVIQMTNAVANMIASGSRAGSAIGSIGNSASRSSGAFRILKNSVDSLTGSMGGMAKRGRNLSQFFGLFYANCFLLIRGVKKLGSAITTSMDYVETYNYFAVTMNKIGAEFGGMYADYGYSSAEAYTNSFADRMNTLTKKMTGFKVGSNGELFMTDSIGLALDPQKVMDFQASIASVTNSVGLCGETSVNTAKALSMLAADFSSLKNVKLETVMTNLQSGLIGQSRALYKYGVDITNNTLQTYAFANGVNKAVSEMTQAEKMQLRLLAILDQSKVAWGDQANTINTTANQYRILKQQISNLARVIGNLFLPIVSKILPVVNGLVIALQRLFQVLGFKLHGNDWLEKIAEETGKGFGGGMDDLADSAEDAEGALSDASKAAGKLRGQLQGFDALNVINTQSQTGSDSNTPAAGGGIDLSGAIGDALAEYESVWDKAFKESENKAQGFADKICAIFDRMWKAIEPFRKSLENLWNNGLSKLGNFAWTGLKDFYDGFLAPIGKWVFGTPEAGLTRMVNIINNSLMAVDWDRLNGSLRDFWSAIEPYAEQFGEGLIDFFEDLSGLAVDIINRFPKLLDKLTNALNKGNPESARKWGYALGVLGVGLLGLKGVSSIIGVITKIGSVFEKFGAGLGKLFGEGGVLAKIGGKIGGLFAKGGIFKSGGSIAASIGSLLPTVAILATVAAALIDLWKTSETFRTSVGFAFDMVKDSIVNAFHKVSEAIAPLWDSIKELGKAFYDFYESSGLKWIVEQLTSFSVILIGIAGSVVIKQISNVISGICKTLSGLADILKGVLKILTGLRTADFSKVKEGFSGIKNGLNSYFSGMGESLFGWIGDVWTDICNKFQEPFEDAWNNIGAWWKESITSIFSEIKEWFHGIWEKIKDSFSQLWEDISAVWESVSDWFNEHVVEPIVGFFSGLWSRVKKIFEGLWIIVKAVWSIVSDWFNEHVVEPVVVFFQELWEKVSGSFSQLWEDISAVWESVSDWFNEHVVTPVTDWFQGLWEKVSGYFSGLWEDVKAIWSKVSDWFDTNTITPLSNAFSNFKNTALEIFDGIWSGIKKGVVGAMNAAIGAIEKAINWIVGAINGILSGFNKVVSWAAKVAEVDWAGVELVPKVKISRISMYESGGFPNTGELFMARENGINEMVGRMGSRNTVANNGQIIEGISIGVENANAEQNALLREQNQLLRQLLEKETGITPRQIHSAVKSEDAIYAKMNGHSAFAY